MEIKNSFLAEAIDRLTDLGKKTTEPTTILANGRTFLVTGTSCEEIDPIEKPQPDKATTASLNALVALLRNEVDKEYTHCPLYVSCGWYDRVRVFTQPDEGDDLHRFTLYEAVATDLPPLVEEVRWGFDEAQIKLRSMFQRAPEGDTNDVDYILGLLSHMSVDQSVKSDDNGVTQTVQVRKGVSFVENQRVRPIVKLAPYRTFQEVEQPESEFVFRVYDDRSIKYGSVYGDVPQAERGGIVDDFQQNPETKVFVAQIQTAGLGITLHAASAAVFYSMDYNYANYAQALARIHRIGQRSPVTYIHLLVEDSIDDKVLAALEKKEDIAKTIVDSWRTYF